MLDKLLATKTNIHQDSSSQGYVLPGKSFPLGATELATAL